MHKWIIWALFLSGIITAQAQTRYLDDLFTEVEKTTLEYAVKDGESLQLDVYQPQTDDLKNRPVLVWVHGGGFSGGERDNPRETKWMQNFTRKGYVAISISYRLLRKGTKEGFSCDCPRAEKLKVFKEAAADLMDAVIYVQGNAEKLGIDPQKIMIGGSSAGAETVLTAAFMRDYFFSDQQKYLDLDFTGMISLAGAMTDVRYLIEGNAIPTVMFHGTDDNLVPYATAPHHYCTSDKTGYLWLDGSHTITQKLSALNTSHLLYTYKGARHEIAEIPFDKQEIIFQFLHDAILQGEYRALSLEE